MVVDRALLETVQAPHICRQTRRMTRLASALSMDDLFQGPSFRPGHYHPLCSLGGIKGLVLHTDDIVAAHNSLSDWGVLLSEIKTEPWGLFATFEDPDGNGWLLRQVPEERA